MTSEANKSQVDGTHYKTAYEHWDYSLDAGLGVLEYAATKHLSRYHKKGEPLVDLRKARHYVQKLTENVTVALLLCPRNRFSTAYLRQVSQRFIEANDVPNSCIAQAIQSLTIWQTAKELRYVLRNIDVVLREIGGEVASVASAAPVPLEDSNKHAPRSDNE